VTGAPQGFPRGAGLGATRWEKLRGVFELRAATILARLWQSQDKHREAHGLLAPVYGWFTEGFNAADLKDTRVLLRELEGRARAGPVIVVHASHKEQCNIVR
jgi:predicted ATPase